jgi:hypothetical protein
MTTARLALMPLWLLSGSGFGERKPYARDPAGTGAK